MAGGKPDKYRKYTDTEKATALAFVQACGGNVAKAAKETGINRATLQKWVAGKMLHEVAVDLVAEKKEELSDIFEGVARKYLTHALRPEVIESAGAKEAVTAAAIAVDKMRLLREQPTSIAGKEELTDDEFESKLRRLIARVRERAVITCDGRGEGGIQPALPAEGGTGAVVDAVPRPTDDSLHKPG